MTNSTSGTPAGSDPAQTELRSSLPIDPSAAFLGRRALRGWLARLGWPRDAAEDLVLAADEAISNSVEHGYRDHPRPGPDEIGIELAAKTVTDPATSRRVRITVTDHGSWETPRIGPSHRGRGLELMRRLVESVEIAQVCEVSEFTGQARGTRITLLSHPV